MDTDPAPRHHLFVAALRRAELTIHQLWLGYLALGGACDAFDVDAYLHGLAPLAGMDQDILAITLNERLDDLYQAARVPYLATTSTATADNALAIIDRLLQGPEAASE